MPFDLMETIRRDSAEVDRYLMERMDAYTRESVFRRSMEYSLFAGGKRIRPFLCMETAALFGLRSERVVCAAAALEMIHTYSLIHDDLPAMDNDDMRRGKPSNHIAFGEANAILAGDGLLSYAFLLLAKTNSPETVSVVAKGALDMVEGQSLDLHPVSDKDRLYRVHSLKTGAMIRSAVISGARLAEAKPEAVDALEAFSSHYGLLFQITDDILDASGNASELGKTVGKDEKEGKYTFVTCFGLDGARQEAVAEAERAVVSLRTLDADTDVLERLVQYTVSRKS